MMPNGARRSRLWLLLAVTVVFLSEALLGVQAQERDTDSATIDIVIAPSGSGDDGTESSGAASIGDTDSGVSGAGVQSGLAGTVSARISRSTQLGRIEDDLQQLTFIVTDERGTALGWELVMSSNWLATFGRPPELLTNQRATISRLLPEDRLSERDQYLTSGLTIGPLDWPVRVIQAPLGSGDGVYMQQLTSSLSSEIGFSNQLFYLDLVFAP